MPELSRIQQTVAIDISRFMAAGLPPKAITIKLWEVPEVALAFSMYERRNLPLSIDPSTDEEKREIVGAIERVVRWLDDGFHEKLVDDLREIASALAE